MIRWSWLILIIAGLTAVSARAVADSKGKTTYVATTLISEQQIQQDKNGKYPAITNVPAKTAPDASHFIVADAANAAAKNVPGLSASQILDKLNVKPTDVSEAELSFEGANKAEAQQALSAYSVAYVEYRRAAQRELITPILTAAQQSAAVDPRGQTVVDTIQGSLDGTNSRIPDPTAVRVTKTSPSVSPGLATLAGLLAGLAIGILLALALNRFDPRVRRASDLEPPGMDVFEATPDGLAALRVDLELSAVGDRGGMITVSPADGATALASATELARSFSDAGVSTLLVDLDTDDGAPGARNFLDGTRDGLELADLGPDLRLLGAGHSAVDDASLFSAGRVKELLAEARKHAQVVVVTTPVLDHHPESLLFVGASDGSVLIVRPSTSWHRLDAEVDRMRRSAGAQLRLWFERKPLAPASRTRVATRLVEAHT
jgi:Mrp family chromosome partitioning ATPase